MTPNEWTSVIASIGAAALTGFTAVSVWLDKRQRREAQEEELKAKRAQEAKQAEWEEAEKVHRRRMEELSLTSIRQGGLAAKEAKKAAHLAAQGKEEVKSAISESRATRIDEMTEVKDLIRENTGVNVEAISKAQEAIDIGNNVNSKIEKLGLSLTGIPGKTESAPVAPLEKS